MPVTVDKGSGGGITVIGSAVEPPTPPPYTTLPSGYTLPGEVIKAFADMGVGAKDGALEFGINLKDFTQIDELYTRTGTAFDGNNNVRTYSRQFRVMTNQIDLTPVDVCQHPALPQPWDPYRNSRGYTRDPYSRAIRSSAEREHGSNQEEWKPWVVTVEYSSEMPEGGPGFVWGWPNNPFGEQSDPQLQRPVWYWEAETVQYPLPRDLDGRSFLNSANAPFSPPPTLPVSFPVLVVIKNEFKWDRAKVDRYAGAVNLTTYLNMPPGSIQLVDAPRPVTLWWGGLKFYRVTYKMRFKPSQLFLNDDRTFQARILDAGFHRRAQISVFGVPIPNTPTPLLRINSQNSTPVLLDGLGQPKRPETVGAFVGQILPVYVQFRTSGEVEFREILDPALVETPPGGP